MIRTWRGKLFWGAVGIAAGTWVAGRMRGTRAATQRVGRSVQRNARAARPAAMHMAANAGKAVMNTTMRTVRTLNRH